MERSGKRRTEQRDYWDKVSGISVNAQHLIGNKNKGSCERMVNVYKRNAQASGKTNIIDQYANKQIYKAKNQNE